MTYTTLAVFGFIYLFTTIYVLLAMCAAARAVRASWKRRINKDRTILLIMFGAMPVSAGPMPMLPPPETNTFYFAATATDNFGLESDYTTNRVSASSTSWPMRVTLAWDPSPSTNIITNYKVYAGWEDRMWEYTTNAGTNLTVQMVLPPPAPPRDLVVTLSMTNGLSLTLTNPVSNLLVRGRSWKVFNKRWPVVMECRSATVPGPWSTLAGPVTNTSQPSPASLKVRVQTERVLR